MKKYTAEEFAAAIIESTASELEYNEYRTHDLREAGWSEEVWDIYAHISDEGELLEDGGEVIHCEWRIPASAEEDTIPYDRPELLDDERATIIADLYPKYLELVADLADEQ